ncbi:MAG: DUF6677 family protein [Phycisphaerae bacterium]
MSKQTDKPRSNWLIAAFLAWILPGAGHVYIGRGIRGAVIFVTIAATFWTGIAIGGVMTVDRRYEPWWFAAEMVTGVHGLIGWQKSKAEYDKLMREGPISVDVPPGTDPRLAKRMTVDAKLGDKALVAPAGTIARAYSGVAGMLNLMCIFDAAVLSAMGIHGEHKRRLAVARSGGES